MPDWGAAYTEHAPGLRHWLQRRTRDREAAEDIVQEAFRRALDARVPLREEAAARGYLYQVAHRLLLNRARRPRLELLSIRPGDGEGEPDPPCPSPSPSDWAEAGELLRRVDEGLAALPPDQALCFRLGVLEGWPYDDVCRETGFSRSKVKICVFRARKALAAGLAPPSPEGD